MGNGVRGDAGYGGPATAANLILPFSIARDNKGNIYFDTHDHLNFSIRKVDAFGIYMKFAGTGATGYSGDGGPATAAEFNDIGGMTFDKLGNMLIADGGNHVIHKIDIHGIITTIAGSGIGGYTGDNGFATNARLGSPSSVKVDGKGNIYIADLFNHVVRKIDTMGIITTIAGNNIPGYSGDGGPFLTA